MEYKGVVLLKNYMAEQKFVQLKTSNRVTYGARFIDFDGDEWIMAKLLDGQYKRIKKASVEKVDILDFA